jgi:hypothetical protein
MNKKFKRYLAGLMTIMTMSTLSGCNMKIFDTTYGFENAVILNAGNSVVIPLSKCKKDYKGESIQLITNDNMAVLTSSFVTDLINSASNKNLASEYAEAMTDKDGTMSFYGEENEENVVFNNQIIDFQYSFDKAIIFQNDKAVIIPIIAWKDYDGEQIQIVTPENVVILTSVYTTMLVSDHLSNMKAFDLASMLVGDGKVTDLAGNYSNPYYNKQFFDFKNIFNKAIMMGDESNGIYSLDSWRDYDGEQLQLKIQDGPTQVNSTFNTLLVDDRSGKEITASVIANALNDKVVDNSFESNNDSWYNKQIFDFNYAFQNATITNGDTSLTLPIKTWDDYDGEQLQLNFKNGVSILSSSVDSRMTAPGKKNISVDDIAKSISSVQYNIDSNYVLNSSYNKVIFDTKYSFPYALVVNDDSIMILSLDSWRDYEGGEQLQLTLADKENTFLSTAHDTKLVNLGNSGLSINEIAAWFNPAGTKTIYDYTNGKRGKGKFNYQLIDTHFLFNYAIAINGDVATIFNVSKWTDFDGSYITDDDGNRTYTDYSDQIQIMFDGSNEIFSDNNNIKLIKANDIEIVKQIARGHLSENGIVKVYESENLIRTLD